MKVEEISQKIEQETKRWKIENRKYKINPGSPMLKQLVQKKKMEARKLFEKQFDTISRNFGHHA